MSPGASFLENPAAMFVLNYAPWVLGENACTRVRVWIKALKTLELAPVPRKDPLMMVVFILFLCLPPPPGPQKNIFLKCICFSGIGPN